MRDAAKARNAEIARIADRAEGRDYNSVSQCSQHVCKAGEMQRAVIVIGVVADNHDIHGRRGATVGSIVQSSATGVSDRSGAPFPSARTSSRQRPWRIRYFFEERPVGLRSWAWF